MLRNSTTVPPVSMSVAGTILRLNPMQVSPALDVHVLVRAGVVRDEDLLVLINEIAHAVLQVDRVLVAPAVGDVGVDGRLDHDGDLRCAGWTAGTGRVDAERTILLAAPGEAGEQKDGARGEKRADRFAWFHGISSVRRSPVSTIRIRDFRCNTDPPRCQTRTRRDAGRA
ncbi:MAG: hypothetical protein JW876_06290 [Candidatus Krumholzibacteriota bacterium]|nr:hypothetical protein [Candidatus Krumholzibacteriota bacterium]